MGGPISVSRGTVSECCVGVVKSEGLGLWIGGTVSVCCVGVVEGEGFMLWVSGSSGIKWGCFFGLGVQWLVLVFDATEEEFLDQCLETPLCHGR